MIERDPATGLALLVCATCGEELDDAQYSDDAECPKCHSELAEEGACVSGFTWRERVAAAEKYHREWVELNAPHNKEPA